MALPPPVKPKGGDKASRTLSKVVELSVFDILNIFRRRWFLSRTALLTHVISAQKAEDGNISWVEFDPPFHSHLVKCAVALVPRLGCPVPMVKRVMFVFILELLNQEGHLAFFDLQKGGRKANNAQKEKRRLARKRSRAAKREREREADKMAHLPTRERSCLGCGRKFNSRKTAKKHKCPDSKVVRTKEAAVVGTSSRLVPPTKPIKLAAPIPPRAPIAPARLARPQPRRPLPAASTFRPAPPHSTVAPPVTGVLADKHVFNFRPPAAIANDPASVQFEDHQVVMALSNAKAKASSMRLRSHIFSPEEIRAAELEEHEAEVEVARIQKRRRT
jgi:predicted RNA-binding Zn-ribbon protein involved in translation (DUF1610 family)